VTSWLPKSRSLATWMAVGICVSIAVISWSGYRAVREWRRSSALLVERRADEAADLLVTALTHDMRAVQKSVLSSIDWDIFIASSPADLSNIVSSAFARYPYPEAFFAAHDKLSTDSIVFFTRSDRRPNWSPPGERGGRFPVTLQGSPAVSTQLLPRLETDASTGRRFSIFETTINGEKYQVITRLMYRDQLHERLDGIFGFMVNMNWVRRYYFPELTEQVARIGGAASGLALAVVDERGTRVTGLHAKFDAGPASRRSFPVMFFDPLLVAVNHSAEFSGQQWTVQVGSAGDPTFTSAIRGANRILLFAALAGLMLAVGLAMTMRAVRANAALAELRSEFVATVTHELKTPLATIRAVGDSLVSGRIATPAAQREYAQLVVQESKSLTRLVDNLLALSRITDVTEVYSFEPQAVDALVEETLQGFGPQLEAAGFHTEIELPADLPLVRADRTAMGLLLDNLVDNAIRYSPNSRHLHIAAHRENGHVVLDVCDKGRGIPEDEIEHVTRKFFRGRHLVPHGGGLGLAIVKRIVTDHGGLLAIRSEVNVGTTVSVIIPVSGDHEEADSRR